MNIQQPLRKWGNGTGVCVPKKVIEAAHLTLNQSLTIDLQGNSIILTPVKELKVLTLQDILADATPELVGGELSWGPDVGQEIIND